MPGLQDDLPCPGVCYFVSVINFTQVICMKMKQVHTVCQPPLVHVIECKEMGDGGLELFSRWP